MNPDIQGVRKRGKKRRMDHKEIPSMKNLRSILVLCSFVLALSAFAIQSSSSSSQDQDKQSDHAGQGHMKRGHMPSAEAQLKHITEALNLTDDQQATVKGILEDTHKQADAVMDDKSLSQEDRHAKLMGLHNAAHAKMRNILTDEQKKKFDDMQQKMQDHMHSQENKGK
jgi:protein CpxP